MMYEEDKLEYVREVIHLLTTLFQAQEEMAQSMAHRRWTYELMRAQGEDPQRVTQANQAHQAARDQYNGSTDVILELMRVETVSEARQKYQTLVTAVNTLGEFKDQIIYRETLLDIYERSGTLEDEVNDDGNFSKEYSMEMLERLRMQERAAYDRVLDLLDELDIPENLTQIVTPKISLL